MVIVALVVSAALLGLLVVGLVARGRARRRIDEATARLGVHPVAASASVWNALARLDRAVDRHLSEEGDGSVAELRIQHALDAMTQGAVVCDQGGTVVFRNRFAGAFVDARHGDALVERAVGDLLRAAAAGEPAEREVELFGPPRRSLLVSALPLRADDGTPVGAIALVDDVTEQQRLDAMRRDFVSNIGHELRTPIGAMGLLADAMAGEDDLAVLKHLGARIRGEAERVAATIDDLLTLSRIEHEDQATREPVLIQDVVDEVLGRIRSAAEQHDVAISVTMPSAPLEVSADRRQLVSAVHNLVDNALKYSDPGSSISVRARALGDGDDRAELAVQDSGYGIPRRDLDRVFERFFRVDRARTRETGGVGLGLAIVRHVMTNHGGEVRVDSVEGEGSTFTLVMPLASTSGRRAETGGEAAR